MIYTFVLTRGRSKERKKAKKSDLEHWSARSQSAGGPIDAAAAGLRVSCPAPSPTRGSCEVDGADFESTEMLMVSRRRKQVIASRAAGEAEARDDGIDCDRHSDTARPGDIYLAVASLIVN